MKMKKINAIILALLTVFALCSCGDKNRTEDILEGDRVVGKSYYEDDRLVKEEFTDGDGRVSEYRQYSADGKVLEKGTNDYNSDGSLHSAEIATYDGDKVVKKDVTVYEDGKASQVRNVKYSYNADGSVLESATADGKNVSEVLRDADGNKLYSTAFEDNGSVKTTYGDGNVVRSETFDRDGKSVGYTEMQYGENGKASGSATYNGDGTLVMTTSYEYAEDGKVSKVLMYDADGKLYQTGTYDKDGKLTLE